MSASVFGNSARLPTATSDVDAFSNEAYDRFIVVVPRGSMSAHHSLAEIPKGFLSAELHNEYICSILAVRCFSQLIFPVGGEHEKSSVLLDISPR